MTRVPLAVGLALGGAGDPRGWAEACTLAAWADGAGLDSLWLPEGHLRRGAPASPLLGLAAFAARTTRIRLGTTSLLISIHDPLRVAAEVATLDQLSGGRVVLGLGRGFEPAVLRAFGVEPRSKRDRFDDALDAMLRAWAEDGEHAAALRPVQRPHPPLYVAAFGAKGLAQAARRGLPYLASPLESLATLERNFARHAELLAAGAPAPPVAVMRTVHVASDAAEARRMREAAAAEFAALAARAAGALADAAAGSADERVLIGEAAEVAEGIARYRERLGLGLLVVRSAARADERERRASLERLVGDVLPAL
ncbi:MAG TPA: LLM class flavin-dependent oxidoreductase [Myxococcota bacterium]|nr:LLM class flavin-dependent oxidoreductase [Myxococcota bacterium]